MNRQSIAKLFGVETYRDALHEMSLENDSLASQVAKLRIRCENLADELNFYKLTDGEKVQKLRDENKELADKYIKMIQIYQEAAANCKAMIDDVNDKTKRAYNHGFSDGRMAAYSEMGIWRLDAIEAGNRLVMDARGDVYELLELQDVKADEDTGKVEDDGIIIDDLQNIGA